MKPSKSELFKFSAVMIIFLIGMIIMLINKIGNIWIWIGYVTLWTWVEMKVVKNFHLIWWAWILIIAAIIVIDLIVIYYLA